MIRRNSVMGEMVDDTARIVELAVHALLMFFGGMILGRHRDPASGFVAGDEKAPVHESAPSEQPPKASSASGRLWRPR